MHTQEYHEKLNRRMSKKPDFAFLGEYYVPQYLLEKYNISLNCQVKAKIIYSGTKWKLIDIEKINVLHINI